MSDEVEELWTGSEMKKEMIERGEGSKEREERQGEKGDRCRESYWGKRKTKENISGGERQRTLQ